VGVASARVAPARSSRAIEGGTDCIPVRLEDRRARDQLFTKGAECIGGWLQLVREFPRRSDAEPSNHDAELPE